MDKRYHSSLNKLLEPFSKLEIMVLGGATTARTQEAARRRKPKSRAFRKADACMDAGARQCREQIVALTRQSMSRAGPVKRRGPLRKTITMHKYERSILRRVLISLVVIAAIASPAYAAETVGQRLLKLFNSSDSSAPAAEEEILDPDQAFRFSAEISQNNTVNLMWQIEDGYYLYHDKFSVSVLESNGDVVLGKPVIPAGKIKVDDSFGSMEINTGDVVINVPVQVRGNGEVVLTLQVGYQGCKENSICYPPIKQQVPLVLAGVSGKKEP